MATCGFSLFFPIIFLSMLMEYNNFIEVKDYVVYKVVNKESNAKLLEKVPYIKYLDLAIIFYFKVPGCAEEKSKKMVLIDNARIVEWGIDIDELMNAASKNTPKILGLKIQGILSTIAEYIDCNDFCEIAELEDSHIPLYVATNEDSCFGASVILYENLLHAISAKLKSDFYIIPCSIHEVIIVKAMSGCEIDTEYLKELIIHVNNTEVPESDVLSNSLYYYSKDNKILSIA